MSEIILREARSSDLEQIIALEQACFPPEQAASPSALKERIGRFGPYFLVAEKGGTIVGMINGMPTNETDLCDEMYEGALLYDPAGGHIMIFGVDTLPAFEHQGIASMLMEAYIKSARKDGRKSIVLTCRKRLIGFYEQFGFVCEGISRSEHGNVIWYQMRIVTG